MAALTDLGRGMADHLRVLDGVMGSGADGVPTQPGYLLAR